MITMTKRFYVGSDTMVETGHNHHYLRATFDECAHEAKKRLLANPNQEEVYIVEVIAVVKREVSPIVVEKVRR